MALAVNEPEDTTKYLWDYKFMCRFPHVQSMSEEYIKFFGMPTTGDPGIDRELNNQWITSMLNINDMLEKSKEGIPIKIVKYDDVKTIYVYISNHLQAWKRQLGDGINIGDAPIEDLIALDAFANLVYDHAKFQFTRGIADSLLGRHLASATRLNRNNFFKPEINITLKDDGITRINPIEENIEPRESLADIFKDRKIMPRKWR